MPYGAQTATWSLVLTFLLLLTIILSAGIGPVAIPPKIVSIILLQNTLDLLHLPTPAILTYPGIPTDTHTTIITTLRLPRILLAAIVGFALATAGTVMQGFFRNPMADPSIIGVSAGAAVGAVTIIAINPTIPFGIETAAFIGALIAAFGVYLIATEANKTPVATLLLAGIAVQTFLSAIVSVLLLLSGENLRQAVFWLMGHLHTANWHEVTVSIPIILTGFIFLLFYTRDLNTLLLGEEDAYTLGVEVEQTKRILLGIASLVTAMSVAVAGIIGFVGLIIPHLMRLLVGPDHRILLPTSALAGASFLVATDTLARLGATEIPVGIITAFIGAPFFLYLLRTREVHAL